MLMGGHHRVAMASQFLGSSGDLDVHMFCDDVYVPIDFSVSEQHPDRPFIENDCYK